MTVRSTIIVIAVAAATLAAVKPADAAVPKRCALSNAPILCKINHYRSETRRLQREMGVTVSPTKHRELQTDELGFRLWVLALWKNRYEKALARWKRDFASWAAQEAHVYRAIRASANFWHVSYGWLVSCAESEGIIGGQILYSPNWAGAAGPFQFLSGTFYSYAPSAFRAAARRGVHIPHQYLTWGSNVGQSWTAGYMFSRGLSYHWYGAGC
jgi:hypothetical protein